MTLVEVLRERAASEGNRIAFRFEGDDGDRELTFAELDGRAAAIAARLREVGPAGERALLVYPPGLAFVEALFGCLYAGWIAAPCPPPTRSRGGERLDAIVRDAQPSVVLTTGDLRKRLAGEARVLDTDTIRDTTGFVKSMSADDVAILQYTSGSTAAPRGVMLTHANVLDNTRQIARRFGMHAASRGVIWLPPYHDMGLIGGILQGVAVGCSITLLSPLAFLRRPARWLETVSRERATVSGGPNFAYDLCVARVSADEKARLDLSSWEVAFVGAEPVRRATLDRFADAFAATGFRREALYPCYGLAEATLMVTGGDRLAGPHVRDGQVSCGRVIDGHTLLVVAPESRREMPEGEVGEIVVKGPSVARGYWAAEQFGGCVATGDLGYVRDGELTITGRIKGVLIVNGWKVHAEDVERTVTESHAGGWPGGVAALSVDSGRQEELVVLQEVTAVEGVERAIRLAVADEHGLGLRDVVLLKPGRLPRTTSGKVRHDACKAEYLLGKFERR